MNRIDVLQKIIDRSGANIYLEIGIGKLDTFLKLKVKNKIAVEGILLEITTESNRALYSGIFGAFNITISVFPLLIGILDILLTIYRHK